MLKLNKISSLKNKLLIIFSLLIILSIVSLTASMIFLFTEDKKAYTYQKQSTEALLVSKEFTSFSQKTISFLRQVIGLVGKNNTVTQRQMEQIQSILQNQDTALYLKMLQFDLIKLTPSNEINLKNEALLKDTLFEEKDFDVQKHLTASTIENLKINGFSFFNPSIAEKDPFLGIIVADHLHIAQNKIFLSVGFVSLQQFANEMRHLKISVATYQGHSLFDSDPKTLYEDKNILDHPLFKIAENTQTSSGSFEFDQLGEKNLGTFIRPPLGLLVILHERWDDVVKATYELIEKGILLSIIIFTLTVILIIIFSKSLTQPLRELLFATEKVAQGDFRIQLQQNSSDEIGLLSQSFQHMSEKIITLIEKEKDKAILEGEIEIAATVQKTLIPPSFFESDQLLIHSVYQSASKCGGDWWGYFPIKNKFCFLIGDATGHGFPSALITASARSCFSAIDKLSNENYSISFTPSEILNFANKSIFDSSNGQIMMTFFVGILDFEKMEISYSSAAHNPPWLITSKEGKLEYKSLITNGIRLGEKEIITELETKTTSFEKGSSIFIYTDGLTEGKNNEGKMFGKKAVKQELDASIAQGGETVINNLYQKFFAHNGDKPLDDDVTYAVIKIK